MMLSKILNNPFMFFAVFLLYIAVSTSVMLYINSAGLERYQFYAENLLRGIFH